MYNIKQIGRCNMKKLLCVLLLIGLCLDTASVASAAEWLKIGEITDGQTFSLDTQSFRKTSDTTYSFWTNVELSEEEGKKLSKTLKLKVTVLHYFRKNEHNFHNATYRTISTTYFGQKGVILLNDSIASRWAGITPKSTGDNLFKAAYDYYKKNYK